MLDLATVVAFLFGAIFGWYARGDLHRELHRNDPRRKP